MFINLLFASVIGISSGAGAPTSTSQFPAEISSKIAIYILVSEACDQMTGTKSSASARETATSVLLGYGYSPGQADVMFNGFIQENLSDYVESVKQAAGGSDPAIRYFCSSKVKESKKTVEEIKAYNHR
jgi:hypothetical protein